MLFRSSTTSEFHVFIGPSLDTGSLRCFSRLRIDFSERLLRVVTRSGSATTIAGTATRSAGFVSRDVETNATVQANWGEFPDLGVRNGDLAYVDCPKRPRTTPSHLKRP